VPCGISARIYARNQHGGKRGLADKQRNLPIARPDLRASPRLETNEVIVGQSNAIITITFSPANYPWTIVTLRLACGIVYGKVKVHRDTDPKAKFPMAVQTPRDAPTEEERKAFPEKMAVPINSGVEG